MSNLEKILDFVEGTIPTDDPYGYRGQNEDGFDGGWDEFTWQIEKGLEIPGIGLAKFVADHGGMDEGSDRWVVFEVNGQLYKKSGFYSSYEGTDWDSDLQEVKAVERPVTFYEAV